MIMPDADDWGKKWTKYIIADDHMKDVVVLFQPHHLVHRD